MESILITDHSLFITQEKNQIQSDFFSAYRGIIFIKIKSNFMCEGKIRTPWTDKIFLCFYLLKNYCPVFLKWN